MINAELKFSPKKILIVKLGSIGDVVNTLPFVNVLRDSWPRTSIAWLIEPKSHPIVEGHPSVDRFIVFRRDRGWAGVKAAVREIKKLGPDLVIDLQRILRSAFFTVLSGCPRRLGFDRARSKELSWFVTTDKIPPSDPGRHMVEQYLEFAAYLGLSWPSVEFRLPVGQTEAREAKSLLPESAAGFIALNIGAAKPANRWPVDRWAALVRLIVSRTDNYCVITGGAEDVARGNEVALSAGAVERLVNLTGKTGLKQLGGLFLLARAVVSGDTGPLHIASALGRPTIGLFGPADPRRTGPYRHQDLVVRSPSACAPCGKRRCGSDRCMEEITPEMVMERIREQIGTPDSASGGHRNLTTKDTKATK